MRLSPGVVSWKTQRRHGAAKGHFVSLSDDRTTPPIGDKNCGSKSASRRLGSLWSQAFRLANAY